MEIEISVKPGWYGHGLELLRVEPRRVHLLYEFKRAILIRCLKRIGAFSGVCVYPLPVFPNLSHKGAWLRWIPTN
jgi:hypothetical protein